MEWAAPDETLAGALVLMSSLVAGFWGRPEVAPGKGGAARDSFGDMGTAAFAN